MTPSELRVLYLLNKAGAPVRHSHISQAMARHKATDRTEALKVLEGMELIKSGESKAATGRPALIYWLTSSGRDMVQELIAKGELGEAA